MYILIMKRLNKKQIVFGSIALGCLLFLIYILICPLGYLSNRYFCYFAESHKIMSVGFGTKFDRSGFDNPFVVLGYINVPQVVIFCVISLLLIACIVLVCKNTPRRPTKAERLQAKIDELQQQVDELKKGE